MSFTFSQLVQAREQLSKTVANAQQQPPEPDRKSHASSSTSHKRSHVQMVGPTLPLLPSNISSSQTATRAKHSAKRLKTSPSSLEQPAESDESIYLEANKAFRAPSATPEDSADASTFIIPATSDEQLLRAPLPPSHSDTHALTSLTILPTRSSPPTLAMEILAVEQEMINFMDWCGARLQELRKKAEELQ